MAKVVRYVATRLKTKIQDSHENALLEGYTRQFIENMRLISPERFKQAILTKEDIGYLMKGHESEMENATLQFNQLPLSEYWGKIILRKVVIKKYIEGVMETALPLHYQVAVTTPGGINYVALQLRKLLKKAIEG